MKLRHGARSLPQSNARINPIVVVKRVATLSGQTYTLQTKTNREFWARRQGSLQRPPVVGSEEGYRFIDQSKLSALALSSFSAHSQPASCMGNLATPEQEGNAIIFPKENLEAT